MTSLPPRADVLLAAALALLIATAAHRAGSLRTSGAVAATFVGTIAFAASPRWGGFLVVWFVLTSALSRLGAARKARHVGAVVAKGGRRDAWQVLANGGLFALGVAASVVLPDANGRAMAALAAVAALSAAGADTWATEVGTWARATAWSLRTGTRVPAGTSGAITWPGSLALCAGAATWTGLGALLGLVPPTAWGAATGGALAGAWADTLVGAWAQTRRRCPACGEDTERPVHACGTATIHAGGLPRLGNDAVNAVATLVAAIAAVLLAR